MNLSSPAARRLVHNRPAMLGLAIVAAMVLFAALGPLLVTVDPNQSDFSLHRGPLGAPPGPSWAHPLGTDPLFRDLLARMAAGARLSLLIAVSATAIAITVGTLIGITAGYAEGSDRQLSFTLAGRRLGLRLSLVDDVLMRLVDVALAFPFLLLVTAVGVAVGRSDAWTVLLILGLTGWTGISRIVRAKTMQLRRTDYVHAARALGASHLRLIRRHILPGVIPALIVIGTHAVAQMILAEAVLSYLTVGIHPPQATWGRMLHEAESYLGARLWLVAVPGFAILLAVLGFTRLGDGLRDALQTSERAVAPSRSGRLPADLLIAALALLLVALAPANELAEPRGVPAAPAIQPVRGGVLRVATMVAVRTLDPALAYDEASGAINEHVFARLVHWDRDGALRPDLAERIKTSDDGLRYTFVLRGGLRFHDGAPLSAADVKRSLERTLHPKTPSPGASLYRRIVGFEDFREGRAPGLQGIVAVDPHTLRIEIDQADSTFLARMTLAFAAPVCPSAGRTVQPKAPPDPCGAGPFRFVSWTRGERIELARFEQYHRRGQPYLDGIRWYTNVPARTQRYRFEAGEIDYVRELSAADVALFQADERWGARGRWSSKHATTGIFLNTELAPFDDVHIRRAVSYAIDSSVLPQVRPTVAPADRMIPDSIPGPDGPSAVRTHDLAAALEQMRLAGYGYDPQTGLGGYPEPIDYMTIPDTFDQAAAEIFQQQLARVGIRIRLRLVSYASWLTEASRRKTVAMGWTGWHADFPDPSNFFEPILISKAIQDEGSQNQAFFSNAELDEVVAKARVEQDRARRMALYQRAEEIVRDQAPWIPVYVARSYELWQPYVMGYAPHPVVPQRFSEVWLHQPSGADEESGTLAGLDTPARGGPP